MFLNTLDRKPLIKDGNGNFIRDLTQSIFELKNNNYLDYSVFRIPKGLEIRPDLISQSAYNNTLHTEFILKFNGISNPFTIADGDVILIPSLETAQEAVKKGGDNTSDAEAKRIRNAYKYIDPTKVPKRDSDIDRFNNRDLSGEEDPTDTRTKSGSGLTEGALPPNLQDEGESNITYRNGRVFFGEGIGESACLQNGMTQSDFLTKVIKSKRV